MHLPDSRSNSCDDRGSATKEKRNGQGMEECRKSVRECIFQARTSTSSVEAEPAGQVIQHVLAPACPHLAAQRDTRRAEPLCRPVRVTAASPATCTALKSKPARRRWSDGCLGARAPVKRVYDYWAEKLRICIFPHPSSHLVLRLASSVDPTAFEGDVYALRQSACPPWVEALQAHADPAFTRTRLVSGPRTTCPLPSTPPRTGTASRARRDARECAGRYALAARVADVTCARLGSGRMRSQSPRFSGSVTDAVAACSQSRTARRSPTPASWVQRVGQVPPARAPIQPYLPTYRLT
ncbi:hypothetical protein FB451DRAFT_1470067 [Mycena latifolia]|nr:hypothetical protein FB451DRAFT_1470067 [Mycena latifolia]